jgi:signal peptidase
MKSNSYIPTQKSKTNCFLFILVLAFIYFLENSPKVIKITNHLFMQILICFIWISIALLIQLLPRNKPKGKLRLLKSIYSWSFIFAIIFLLINFFGGLIDGFGRSPYDHSPMAIILNIIIATTMLIGRESIRNFLVSNLTQHEDYLIFISIALLMTLTSISVKQFTSLNGYEVSLKFLAQFVAPEFSKNLLVTYLVYIGGTKSSVIYMGILLSFSWLSPILPDLQWITAGLIGVLCPVFSLLAMQKVYTKELNLRKTIHNQDENILSLIVTSILSISIIWFAVGVFPTYPSVIATGSMIPVINPGDVILLRKIESKNLNVGDIIQFKKDNILISHRIIEVLDNNKDIEYRTKGDNNSTSDMELVKPENIKGKLTKVIPKIGWPTLFLKKDDNETLNKVQF